MSLWTSGLSGLGFAEELKKIGEAAQQQFEAQIKEFNAEAEKAEVWKEEEERRQSRLAAAPSTPIAAGGDAANGNTASASVSAGRGGAAECATVSRASPSFDTDDFQEDVNRALVSARAASRTQPDSASRTATNGGSSGASTEPRGGANPLADGAWRAGGASGRDGASGVGNGSAALLTPATRPRHVSHAPAPAPGASTVRARAPATPNPEPDQEATEVFFLAMVPPPLPASASNAIAAARTAAAAARRPGGGGGGSSGGAGAMRGSSGAGEDTGGGGMAPWELRLRSMIAEMEAEDGNSSSVTGDGNSSLVAGDGNSSFVGGAGGAAAAAAALGIAGGACGQSEFRQQPNPADPVETHSPPASAGPSALPPPPAPTRRALLLQLRALLTEVTAAVAEGVGAPAAQAGAQPQAAVYDAIDALQVRRGCGWRGLGRWIVLFLCFPSRKHRRYARQHGRCTGEVLLFLGP
jgi:hypothetical protein